MNYTIYTDGACDPNPGIGGWGAIVEDGKTKRHFVGGCGSATNNSMEFEAVIQGIQQTPLGATVHVISDSQLVIKIARGQWKASKVRDHAFRLCEAMTNRTVTFEWVRGHSGNLGNELADRIATLGRSKTTCFTPSWGPVELDDSRIPRDLPFLPIDNSRMNG